MIPPRSAGVGVAVALGLALAAAGQALLLPLACGLAVLLLAVGWAALIDLPSPRGSATVLTVTAVTGVVVVALGNPITLAPLAPVLALGVVAAFAHQLLRTDGRPRLVESVTGVVAGAALGCLVAGHLVLADQRDGAPLVVVTAVAVAAGTAVGALPRRAAVVAPLVLVAAVGAATLTALLHPGVVPGSEIPGVLLGVGAGIAVVACDRVLGDRPSGGRTPALYAAAVAPLCATGAAAAVGGLLLLT